MKHILVSCMDIKSGLFTPPVPFRSEAEAIRAYGEAIPRDPMLSKYPSDFELHSVAEWDNENGALIVIGKRICNISEIHTPVIGESEVAATSGGKFQEVSQKGSEGTLEESAATVKERRIYFGGSEK